MTEPERSALLQFAEDMQTALNKLKTRLAADAEQPAPPLQKVWTWDPLKIKWKEEDGFKGRYEKSEDAKNPEFQAMLKDLQEHKGKLNRGGRFYWTFNEGTAVGRKLPQ
jgi:hypothetical protein